MHLDMDVARHIQRSVVVMSLNVNSLSKSSLDYSSWFPTNSSNNSGDTLLADYAAIKNGSLKKLYKAYYSTSDVDPEAEEKKSEAYSTVKGDASKLRKTLDKLQSSSLYDGNSTDKLYSAVSDFVNDYNKAFSSAASESAESTNSMALKLGKTTSTYTKQLESIGISMDEDGKLSIYKDKFKEAVSTSSGLATAKDLFGSSYGYSNTLTNKASVIESIAGNKVTTGNKTYKSDGNGSSVLDSLIDVDA